jgi:hypothetical protein
VNALKATILADVGVNGPGVAATNPTAYETYLEGRFALNRRTPTSLVRAAELLTAATMADAGYAPAYAKLADAYAIMGVYGVRGAGDVMPLARANAVRALALDPSLADAHAVLGYVAAVYDHDWGAAADGFARAITLEPSHVASRQWRAVTLHVPKRRFAEAFADADLARALDPLSPTAGLTAGIVRGFAGDDEASIAILREVLEAEPGFGMAHFFIGIAPGATARGDRHVRARHRHDG